MTRTERRLARINGRMKYQFKIHNVVVSGKTFNPSNDINFKKKRAFSAKP